MMQFPKHPPRPRDTQPVELTEADIEAFFTDPSERITVEFDCIGHILTAMKDHPNERP